MHHWLLTLRTATPLFVPAALFAQACGHSLDTDDATSVQSPIVTAPNLVNKNAVEALRTRWGGQWQFRVDESRDGALEFAWGGSLRRNVDVSDDARLQERARIEIDALSDVLGFGSTCLKYQETRRDSQGTIAVLFHQVVDGIPLYGANGSVTVFYSASGDLIALDNKGFPVTDVNTEVQRSNSEALQIADAAFAELYGNWPAAISMDQATLELYPFADANGRFRLELAHIVDLSAQIGPEATDRVAHRFAVQARGDAKVLMSESRTFHQQQFVPQPGPTGTFLGHTQGWAQPGHLPDQPVVLRSLPDVRLANADGTQTWDHTDAEGDFSFQAPKISPFWVYATLVGQYSQIENEAQGEAALSIAKNLKASVPATYTFNTAMTAHEEAQLNAHLAVSQFRDFILGLDPAEGELGGTLFGLQFLIKVNASGDPCASQYIHGANPYIVCQQAGTSPVLGTCANTAYAGTLMHELGHWAVVLYGSSNGSRNFREAAADIWAAFALNDPIIGRNLHGPSTRVRTGLTTRRKCPDVSGVEVDDCYPINGPTDEHMNSEVLFGAVWKVRERLMATHGAVAGASMANKLMLYWFQNFNDDKIKDVIRDHWLFADSVKNMGMNQYLIDSGFNANGFGIPDQPTAPHLFSVPYFVSVVSGGGDVNNDGYDDVIIAGSGSTASARVFSGADHSILHDYTTGISDVSHAGDVNNDGYDDVLIGYSGAPGAAQVHSGLDFSILLSMSGQGSDTSFGASVSNFGDLNGDGYDDLLVGEPFADFNGTDSGTIWVKSGLNGSTLLTCHGPAPDARFGSVCANAGDVNNDGHPDIILGNPTWDNGGPSNTNPGGAWVISGAGTCTTLYSYVGTTLPIHPANEFLGTSVAGVGDGNQDGYDDFIIGSPGWWEGTPTNGAYMGRAIVYSGATGLPIHTFVGEDDNSEFGRAVSGAGDFNNDGVPDFVIGAPYHSPFPSIDGLVRVYSGLDGLQIGGTVGTTNGAMGYSVSAAGDYDADGIDDVIAGDRGSLSKLLFGNAKVPNPYSLTHVNGEWPNSHSGLLSDDVPALWVEDSSPPTPGSWPQIAVHGGVEHAGLSGRLEYRVNAGSWATWLNNVDLNSEGYATASAQVTGSSGDVWHLRWTSGSESSNEVEFTLN